MSIVSPIFRPLTRRVIVDINRAALPAWNPRNLFAAGEQGAAFDFTNANVLFQDSAGTTPITALGQSIQKALDISGKNNHATQATTASAPLFLGLPTALGSEVVTNGRFTADASWTKGTGWSITAPMASKTAGTAANLSQAQPLVAGQAYLLHFNVTRTAGTLTPQFSGGTTVLSLARTVSGTYLAILVAKAGNNSLDFVGDASFAGSVYNVSLKPITASSCNGAKFTNITATWLATAANINMSSSQQATVVMSMRRSDSPLNRQLMEFANVYGGIAGSFDVQHNSLQTGRLKGTGAALVSAQTTENLRVPNANVMSFQFDLTQATPATEVIGRTHGTAMPLGTTAGTTTGGNLAAAGDITVGRSKNVAINHDGMIHRMIVVGRKLTASELLAAEKWCMQGMVYAAVIGDSTVANDAQADGAITARYGISSQVAGMVCGNCDVSHFGDKIANQLTAWNAIPDKTQIKAVMIQIGLNDVNTYIGNGSKTAAQVISDLQNLVNTVNSTKPTGCKTYIAQMTPCRGWLGSSTSPALAYAGWIAVNQAIAGGGPTPITGVDAVVSSHVAALNDGNDYLLPIYDDNNDHVHPSSEARFIVAQAWRAQFVADGLLA